MLISACISKCGNILNSLLYNPNLTLNHKSQLLTTLRKKAFENIVGKGEYAGNQHFLLFPTMFSTLPKLDFGFLKPIYFAICRCFQFGQLRNFVSW